MNVDIAYRLSKLRRERNLSQEALANQLGVSRQAVSKWERAESSPDTDNLIALADLYDMSLDDLLKGDPRQRTIHRRIPMRLPPGLPPMPRERPMVTRRPPRITRGLTPQRVGETSRANALRTMVGITST